jgi:hypothetical protein
LLPAVRSWQNPLWRSRRNGHFPQGGHASLRSVEKGRRFEPHESCPSKYVILQERRPKNHRR